MINLKPGSEIFRIQKYFKIMKTDSDKCQESCAKTGLETLRAVVIWLQLLLLQAIIEHHFSIGRETPQSTQTDLYRGRLKYLKIFPKNFPKFATKWVAVYGWKYGVTPARA